MKYFKTPVSVLQDSATTYPTLPAVRLPQQTQDGSATTSWKDITFAQLQSDVDLSARYWTAELLRQGCTEGSVVGLWLKGTSYQDILHIWGVQRAGFVPQLFSLKIDNLSVLYNLLKKADATALICESTYKSNLVDCPLPTFSADVDFLSIDTSHVQVSTPVATDGDEVIMIFHTSGSSSGSPKLVPLTARWLDFTIDKMKAVVPKKDSRKRQQVAVAVGNLCHVGNPMLFTTFLDRGGCFILPTEIPFPSSELRQLVADYGLTTLPMFGTYLSRLLREARDDDSLLDILKGLDYVTYGGVAPDEADETWAIAQGINLVNVFASTEVGFMMQSVGGQKDSSHLAPLPGSLYEFIPVSDGSLGEEKLLELVIPPESPDCPHEPLRDSTTGKFHTGDLFFEVEPGEYLIRGRNDDWIKTEASLRCDTRAIENNAMEMCGKDLIGVAVVVGAGRPSPVLIVEPKHNMTDPAGFVELKEEILRRIRPFHERRYVHERILDVGFIMVVPKGLLPRTATKGNVQRKIVEQEFKEALNKVYVR